MCDCHGIQYGGVSHYTAERLHGFTQKLITGAETESLQSLCCDAVRLWIVRTQETWERTPGEAEAGQLSSQVLRKLCEGPRCLKLTCRVPFLHRHETQRVVHHLQHRAMRRS